MTSKRRSASSGDPFANPASVSAGRLREACIRPLKGVQSPGSVEAYRRVKALYPHRISLNMLWGLEAALLGIRWDQLPDEIKANLRAQVAAADAADA